jgi:hypothetical protein
MYTKKFRALLGAISSVTDSSITTVQAHGVDYRINGREIDFTTAKESFFARNGRFTIQIDNEAGDKIPGILLNRLLQRISPMVGSALVPLFPENSVIGVKITHTADFFDTDDQIFMGIKQALKSCRTLQEALVKAHEEFNDQMEPYQMITKKQGPDGYYHVVVFKQDYFGGISWSVFKSNDWDYRPARIWEEDSPVVA